jgi:predicted nucleotidyltransferase component of viral defense system
MDRTSPYYKQVALLIRVLPFVAQEGVFALKGGTAINLFVRDFPRLSVDIDLAYLPLEPRAEALKNVRSALQRIVDSLNQEHGIVSAVQDNRQDEMRIIVNTSEAQIKVEVSPVARGTLHPPVMMDIIESVEDEFGFASIQVVSLPDLYGSKLCAALDRQHPRDLFDVKILLETEGINREIFNGFITYLLSHNRPLSEVLNPRWKDLSETFEKEFKGMTFATITFDELNQTTHQMIKALRAQFTQQDYDFLKSFKAGQPDWSLTDNPQIQNLPAVKWKLQNIQRIPQNKHLESIKTLNAVMDTRL